MKALGNVLLNVLFAVSVGTVFFSVLFTVWLIADSFWNWILL